MEYVLFGIGAIALIAYILYQAVMLDTLYRHNKELLKEVEALKPPF
jgi:hypothetical protein